MDVAGQIYSEYNVPVASTQGESNSNFHPSFFPLYQKKKSGKFPFSSVIKGEKSIIHGTTHWHETNRLRRLLAAYNQKKSMTKWHLNLIDSCVMLTFITFIHQTNMFCTDLLWLLLTRLRTKVNLQRRC